MRKKEAKNQKIGGEKRNHRITETGKNRFLFFNQTVEFKSLGQFIYESSYFALRSQNVFSGSATIRRGNMGSVDNFELIKIIKFIS